MSLPHPAALLPVAQSLCAAGISVIPINHRTKRPCADLLPRDPNDKPVWKPYQSAIPDSATLQHWFANGSVKSLAVVGGAVSAGVLVIDFDIEGFYEQFLQKVGRLAEGLPVQRTGGGGYQIFLRCPEPGGNQQLAFSPCDSQPTGREIAIETRGEGGYAIVPPSLHPSGNAYVMLRGSLSQIPFVPQEHVEQLLATARELDLAPHTRQELHRLNQQVTRAQRADAQRNVNGEGSVIQRFNEAHTIEAILLEHGYVRCGKRLVRPGGKSYSVTILNGRSFHFSSNDPLNDRAHRSGNGCNDAFSAYCKLEHGGDVRAAVKAAAERLGVAGTRRQNTAAVTGLGDKTPTGDSANDVLSPSPLSPLIGDAAIDLREQVNYVPFPTDLLPFPLPEFICDAAAAIGCDDAMVALPLLVGLATAIGTTRRIEIKRDWKEFAILWGVIVASSGQRKSPGFEAALAPLKQMQQAELATFTHKMADYRKAQLEYKRSLSNYHKQNGGDPPEEPVRPTLKRYIVSDTTVEALAMILQENPRGLGTIRDELSGWLGSFNQYKPGRGGSDLAQWLELHRGGSLLIDRKSAECRTLFVARAAVNVCGTIQPGVLARACGKEQFESGLVARTLFAMPTARPRRWTDAVIDQGIAESLAVVYRALVQLELDEQGNPIDLSFTSDAQRCFARFVDEHGAEQETLGDEPLEAAWSKLEGYAARLALIIHLVRDAMGDPSLTDGNIIDLHSVERGVALARWFAAETARVYGDIGASDGDRRRMRLLDIVRANGGSITARELARRCRRYRSSRSAEAALAELVSLKLGAWKDSPFNVRGGRPQRHLVLLSDSGDGAETSLAPSSEAVLSPEQPSSVTTSPPPAHQQVDDEDAERQAIRWADGFSQSTDKEH